MERAVACGQNRTTKNILSNNEMQYELVHAMESHGSQEGGCCIHYPSSFVSNLLLCILLAAANASQWRFVQ
jgi:hypothetical protein